jgi:hypothetical protein
MGKNMINFFKFLRALTPGTILYDKTTNHLLISCGCKSYVYRFFFGLNLKTEVITRIKVDDTIDLFPLVYSSKKIELTRVTNLNNYTIIGNLK